MKDVLILRFEITDSESPDEISLVHLSNAERKEVKGNVYLQVNKPITLKQITIKLQGECLALLQEISSTYVFMREQLFSVKCHLINTQEGVLAEPTEFGIGEHSVPFTMSIRADLPSSQECKLGDKLVTINYRMGAALETEHNAISSLVRSVCISKPAVDTYYPIKIKQFTFQSTLDMFPIKQINFNGKRERKIEYSVTVPERVLVPLQRIHIRGTVLPLHSDSVVDHIAIELCQQNSLSLVSKDPLRPSTFPMLQVDAHNQENKLAERKFKYEPKQGADRIDLDFDVYFKQEDVVATFDSPMLEVHYFVRMLIVFTSEQKRMALKFPVALSTVLETYDLPVSPPMADQSLPEYSVADVAPSYDADSSTSP